VIPGFRPDNVAGLRTASGWVATRLVLAPAPTKAMQHRIDGGAYRRAAGVQESAIEQLEDQRRDVDYKWCRICWLCPVVTKQRNPWSTPARSTPYRHPWLRQEGTTAARSL